MRHLPELRIIWALAVPVIIGRLGTMGLGVVDTLMVGRLGEDALASVAMAHIWAFSLVVVGFGALSVIDPLVSQAHGAKDRDGVRRGLALGVGMALLMAPVLLVWHLTAGPGLSLLGQPAELLPVAAQYTAILGIGVPPLIVFNGIRHWLQGIERMSPATHAVLLGNLVNVPLNLGLMFGWGGLPELGVIGCAWSSAICQYIMLGALVIAARRDLRDSWTNPLPQLAAAARSLWQGLPLGLQIGVEVWAFQAAALMMGWLGKTQLAAHMVVLNLSSLAFMIPLGVSAAAATRVGNRVGALKPWGTSATLSVALGGGITAVAALTFVVMPGPLVRLYTSDPDVIAVGLLILPLAGAFQIFDGIQVVSAGVLRGLGDIRLPALIVVFVYWVVGVPAGALMAFGLDWGPQGVWGGLVAGLTTASVVLPLRIRALHRRGRRRPES